MVLEPVGCPKCHTTDVVKNGKSAEDKQRYRGRSVECPRASFILNYSYRGYLPAVKQPIADRTMNGSGIQGTARVLQISPTTVIEALQKTSPPGNDQSPFPRVQGNAAYGGDSRSRGRG